MRSHDSHLLNRLSTVEAELRQRQPDLVRAAVNGAVDPARLRELAEILGGAAAAAFAYAAELDGRPTPSRVVLDAHG